MAVNNYTPTYEPEKVPVVVNDKHARPAALEQVRAELGNKMQTETTLTVIEFLIDAYPRQEINPGTIRTYVVCPADIPRRNPESRGAGPTSPKAHFSGDCRTPRRRAGLMERAMNIPDAYTAG